jgi:type III restriction enzyme
VKNEHLGFEVHYVFRGVVGKYRPDFLIRLSNATLLVLEVKGQESDESAAKRAALEEWIRAVNAHGDFGRWAADLSFNTADLPGLLRKHSV